MGQSAANAPDKARASLSGAFNANGNSAAVEVYGRFNVWFSGGLANGIALERSYDGGQNWFALAVQDGSYAPTVIGFGGVGSSISKVLDEPEAGILYRISCTNYISGTINYRISQ